jgi:hypothetical protein
MTKNYTQTNNDTTTFLYRTSHWLVCTAYRTVRTTVHDALRTAAFYKVHSLHHSATTGMVPGTCTTVAVRNISVVCSFATLMPQLEGLSQCKS